MHLAVCTIKRFLSLIHSYRGKKVAEKNMMLFSNFGSPFGDDGIEDIIDGIKNLETNFTIVYV